MSSISACRPWTPASAALGLVLKSPLSMRLELQAVRLPLSNPSAKIRSLAPGVALGVGVCVTVAVAVAVPVQVGVGDGPTSVYVAVAVAVAVFVGVTTDVEVLVRVGVAVGVFVRVGVGVRVALPPGVFVWVGIGEGPAVDVGGGLSTAFRAAAASTIPLPHVEVLQLLPAGKERAGLWRI